MTANDYATQIYNTVVKDQEYSDTLGKIIVAQAETESAHFTSDVFTRTNNPFGMTYNGQKLAGISESLQPKKEGGLAYASYPNVQVSTLDLIAWLERRQAEGKFNIDDLTTPDAYAQALKDNGYYSAPESQYSNNIQYYYNKLSTYAQTNPLTTYGIGGAVVLGIGLATWGVIKMIRKK